MNKAIVIIIALLTLSTGIVVGYSLGHYYGNLDGVKIASDIWTDANRKQIEVTNDYWKDKLHTAWYDIVELIDLVFLPDDNNSITKIQQIENSNMFWGDNGNHSFEITNDEFVFQVENLTHGYNVDHYYEVVVIKKLLNK